MSIENKVYQYFFSSMGFVLADLCLFLIHKMPSFFNTILEKVFELGFDI